MKALQYALLAALISITVMGLFVALGGIVQAVVASFGG